MEIPQNDQLLDSMGDVCDNQCRICLKDCTEARELFKNGNAIPRKLMAIAPVQVEEGDGLPPIICATCSELLDICYDFQCQIQSADQKLRQMVKLISPKETGINSTSIVKQIITDVISTVISSERTNDAEHTIHESSNLNEASVSPFIPDNTEFCPDPHIDSVMCYNKDTDILDKHASKLDENSIHNISDNQTDCVQSCWPYQTVESIEIEKQELCVNGEEINKTNISCIVKSEVEDLDELTVNESQWQNQSRINSLQEQSNNKSIDDEEKPLIWRTSSQRCAYCTKSFHSKLALQRHIRVHKHKSMLRYVCHMCDKQYSSVANLKSHVSHAHESQKKKTLKQSLKERKANKKLQRNHDIVPITEKKNFKFKCKVCSKQFTYHKSFVTHAKSHAEYRENAEETEKVEEKEEEKNDMEDQQHELEEEEDEAEEAEDDDDRELPMESLQCTQCRKLFATKRNLQRHISTHSGLKYNCTTCGKGFSRVDKLKDHEQSKHKTEMFDNSDSDDRQDDDSTKGSGNGSETRKKEKYSRPHKCAVCPKSFAQAQSLANHMERHKRVKETQKRFLCEVCSKCFAQSGSLVAHMRTHTGVKPYVCNVCSRAFTKSTYLQLHMRTHSGEKPYICQYCSRAFARANTLARHITMHTGEAKYHCQICTKSFRRLTSLNEHTYTHTGQRPYACKICTKRYNNAGSLYAHRKKCKAQQLVGTGFTVSVDNAAHQTDVNVPQVLIYSQRKLMEDTVVTQVTPAPQYMLTNTQNQKNLSANVIQPFTVEDPNVYSINSKQFKNPYYTIYPNM